MVSHEISNNPQHHIPSLMVGDFSYRCITKKNNTCLVINNNLGNICENISDTFENVYSLIKNSKNVLTQENKFRELNIKNISVIENTSDYDLPFEDEFFDLVIFFESDSEMTSSYSLYFKEIKRVLKSSGCFCFGGNNKRALKLFGKNKQLSDNKFFLETYNTYFSSLNNFQFKIKPYWNVGWMSRPYFISSFDDIVLAKWIFSNLEKILILNQKLKLIFSIVKKSNLLLKRFFIRNFAPSFIFFSYKDTIPYNLDDMIKEKTGYSKIIQQVRFRKISFILFDSLGNPKKKLTCKRGKINLKTDSITTLTLPPNEESLKKNLLLNDWVEGTSVDLNNTRETTRALNWLLNFQLKTTGESFNLQKITHEIEIIKENLHDIGDLKHDEINQWLDNYVHHVDKLCVHLTSVHGDFNPNNILVDMNNSSVNLIDWDTFEKSGSPFYDIGKFVYHVLTPDSRTKFQLDLEMEEFVRNTKNIKNHQLLEKLNMILTEYFGNTINLIIVLRYYFIKDLAMNPNINKPYFIKLLKELKNIN